VVDFEGVSDWTKKAVGEAKELVVVVFPFSRFLRPVSKPAYDVSLVSPHSSAGVVKEAKRKMR
jgi:hypothetical protein